MSAFDLLKQAISEQKQIQALYDGCRRIASPHQLGYDQQGNAKVLLYQTGGASASGLKGPGSKDDWRCMFVREMDNVAIMDGPFRTPRNYSRAQTCMTSVVAEIFGGGGRIAAPKRAKAPRPPGRRKKPIRWKMK